MVMDSETQARYAYNGKVMLGSAILLFVLILTIIFLHTYRHSCFRRRRHHHHHPHRVQLQTNSSTATPFNKGLHRSVLNFLPTFTYSSATHDCAVCLSEFADDDKGRILPNCNHAFHSHCIDEWFRSHSNCPLCRVPVQPPPTASSNIEPCSVSERGADQMEVGRVGCSSFPAPVGCPRKPLEIVGIIVELPKTEPEEEDERLRGQDNRIPSLKRFLSL